MAIIEWLTQSSGFGKIRLPRFIWLIILGLDLVIPDPIFLIDEIILAVFGFTPT